MLKPTYPLETPRLRLRPFTLGDLTAFHAIYSRPDVVRYLYTEPLDLDGARESLERKKTGRTELREEGDALCLAVERRDTGELIGDCMLRWASEAHSGGEIGWVFDPAHHGHGYATEAARELLRLGFAEMRLHRIHASCDARNTASARMMERLGMRREAHLVENEFVKGEWTDEFVYALLRREWEAGRPS
ncbi:GNAT family N-acetyltransferase [Bailinhaonella thermotolerans]|uniref:N-acetyltransferase n=1 Tax=Bailinhaonella thermotolerans TaxID=1070861 RepID=A0A3A4B1N2_9ACTN|nr:GNAT family N-acetyltransferase [Bailinhaonella thermotolerans]RJL32013.1 N-acetyltransferase [Bailinhaonella thermotolerans]